MGKSFPHLHGNFASFGIFSKCVCELTCMLFFLVSSLRRTTCDGSVSDVLGLCKMHVAYCIFGISKFPFISIILI
jgi:hypothetical protein